MFTLSDICNIAIQIERNGEAVYRQASEAAYDEQTTAMLKKLADDELRHAKWFADLELSGPGLPDDSPLQEAGRELIQGMMANQSFSLETDELSLAQKIEEVIAQSIAFEKDTILFYEMLGGFIDDENVAGALNRIIAEEKMHVEDLKSISANSDEARGAPGTILPA